MGPKHSDSALDAPGRRSVPSTVVVALLAFLAALFVGDFFDIGLSTLLGTSRSAVSGATILAAAIVFVAIFAKYIDLMIERHREFSKLSDEVDDARRAIEAGLAVAGKIRARRTTSGGAERVS